MGRRTLALKKGKRMNKLHENNFGFLRLLFAYLVIFSHSSELVYINPSKDLLYTLTGSLTFGWLAVDGFFLISGYLIYQSYENSKKISNYVLKRVLRIYPGFIVASFLSIIFVVSVTNNWSILTKFDLYDWVRLVLKTFGLSTPYLSGLVMNASLQQINDSMWTIRYEFICYLLVPLIALIAPTKKSVSILALAFISTLIYITAYDIKLVLRNSTFFDTFQFFRLSSAFLIGACFYIYRDAVTWDKKYNSFCCVALVTVWFVNVTFFEIGLIVFGSYLLFNFAFNFKNKMIEKVGSKTDISYGVYLYAWPIQIAIIQYYSSINPWLLSAMTIILSTICGYISWICVEKPFINMKKKLIA